MSSLIKIERLTKRLTEEMPMTLVEEATLEVQSGEFVVITGPSGSGKSSLLYLLGLLDTPTAGTIWLKNKEVTNYEEDQLAEIRLREIGFVFQFHFLLPEFSVLENVMLPMRRLGRLSKEEMHTRAEKILEDLGLDDQRHKVPRQLSGGQSQRVAIARALANDPSLILADEPTGNLDTASSANVQRILRDLARRDDHAVVVVTHDKQFAATADKVITIVDGKIVKSP